MEHNARKAVRREKKQNPTPMLNHACKCGDMRHTEVQNWSFPWKDECGVGMSLEEISDVLSGFGDVMEGF